MLSQGGTFDPMFRLWDLDTATDEAGFLDFRVSAVAYTPDGESVAIGGDNIDPVIRLLDEQTGAELMRFEGHGDEDQASLIVQWNSKSTPRPPAAAAHRGPWEAV